MCGYAIASQTTSTAPIEVLLIAWVGCQPQNTVLLKITKTNIYFFNGQPQPMLLDFLSYALFSP